MSTLLVVALAGSVLLAGDTRAAWDEPKEGDVVTKGQSAGRKDSSAAGSSADIRIAFKLDPRLTQGLYMGERWVSPPTYKTQQAGDALTVQARAEVIDASGGRVRAGPTWVAARPEMVTITPGEGTAVEITVRGVGESRVAVTAGAISRELTVRASRENDVLKVEIAQTPSAVAPTGEEKASLLPGQKERMSYALGMDLGRRLTLQSLDVDVDLLSRGLEDALAGKGTLLTEAEVKAALLVLQQNAEAKRASEGKVLGDRNRTEGEAFLADNKGKAGVVTLESGLQYKVLKAGDGRTPTAQDTVVCHYRGTLIDGKEFDSSHNRKQPATFALSRVIKGWGEALQLMPVGSKWQLFIPSNLAYGERGSRGSIGPNATLVFEVELLSIKDKAASAGGRLSPRQKPPGSAVSEASPR